MESNYTRIPRKSSTSRSNIIENCIFFLSESLKTNHVDLEDISVLIINNTLPNELRSIAWKIFLGILPKDQDMFEWIKIIKNERVNFEKLSSDKEVEDYVRVIRKEADESTVSGSLLDDYKLVVSELEKMSSNYDFFKSQIVAETLLRLFIIWKKNNADFTATIDSFYILAGVIYSLYPSILHFNTNMKEITKKEDVDARTFFYFVNDEEFFDADVYLVFDYIMNKKELKKFINDSSKMPRQELETISEEIARKDEIFPLTEQLRSLTLKNMNRFEQISYLYLKIANKQLLSHLFSIKLDPYEITQTWFTSLLTSSISLQHLPYFWDNVFINSMNETRTFEYLDYVIVAMFCNLAENVLNADELTARNLMLRYPENNMNLKDIIKKSFKLREKICELMH